MATHVTSGRWKLGAGLALFTALMWGSAPVALKLLLGKMDLYTISWFRFTVSFFIIMAWVYRRHGLSVLPALKASAPWLVLAALGLSGNYLFFMLGLERMPPSAVVVIIQLAPMFLLFGGVIIFRERYSRRQFGGFLILVCGLLLFFNQRMDDVLSGAGNYPIGFVLVVLAAVTWAVYALTQKQLLEELPSEAIMMCVYLGGALFFTPMTTPGDISGVGVLEGALLVFVCLNTALAYGTFSESLDHLEASRVSTILSLVPLVTIVVTRLLDFIFPDFIVIEEMNGLSVLGALMVVFGSAINSFAGKRPGPVQ